MLRKQQDNVKYVAIVTPQLSYAQTWKICCNICHRLSQSDESITYLFPSEVILIRRGINQLGDKIKNNIYIPAMSGFLHFTRVTPFSSLAMAAEMLSSPP